VLEIAGVGSRALPKGFQHTGPEHTRPFQALYDQRYTSAVPAVPAAPPKADSRGAHSRYSKGQGQGQPLGPPRIPQGSTVLRRPPSTAGYSSASDTASDDKKKSKKKFFGF
jgi:hypothetical protein